MKKHLLLALIIGCAVGTILSEHEYKHKINDDEFSKTFMYTHPANQNLSMMQAGWHTFIYNKKTKNKTAAQFISFYEESLPNLRTGIYFLPVVCSNKVEVRGDNANDVLDRDVRSEWLRIDSDTFTGSLSLYPKQKQFGIRADIHQDLGNILNISLFEDYWINFSLPITIVENDIGFQQHDIGGKPAFDAEGPHDLFEAFNQSEWRYGRIPTKKLTAIGLSELSIRVGRAYLARDNFQLIYYSGLNIPTTTKNNPKYLFDAYAGNNSNIGFITGVNFNLQTNRDTNCFYCCVFANLESTFFIRDTQYRTVDLKHKPWSRYLLFNKKGGPPDQLIPGVNVLTLKMRVRPYTMLDFSAGWRVGSDWFEGEVAYGIWGHGDEKVRPLCHFPEIYGIAGTGELPDHTATSASKSTIKEQADNDRIPTLDCSGSSPTIVCKETFVTIDKKDLDFKSAASQSAFVHRFHMCGSFLNKCDIFDAFLSVGIYYEAPQNNAALNLIGVWAKCGATF